MNSLNSIYVVIILLKLKIYYHSRKKVLKTNVKDFSISPYIPHPQNPPLTSKLPNKAQD